MKVFLSFVKQSLGTYMQVLRYPVLSEDILTQLKNNFPHFFNAKSSSDYVFSFGRFVEFNQDYHGKAMLYLLNNVTLDRKIISETQSDYEVTYNLKNEEDIKKNLNLDQMKFLCGICHQLNLKSYIIAFASFMIKEFKINFEDIKTYAKSDQFNLNLFYK